MEEEKKRLKLRLEEIELYEFLNIFEVFYDFKKMLKEFKDNPVKIDSLEIRKYFSVSITDFIKFIEKSSIFTLIHYSPDNNEIDGHDGHNYYNPGYVTINKIQLKSKN